MKPIESCFSLTIFNYHVYSTVTALLGLLYILGGLHHMKTWSLVVLDSGKKNCAKLSFSFSA